MTGPQIENHLRSSDYHLGFESHSLRTSSGWKREEFKFYFKTSGHRSRGMAGEEIQEKNFERERLSLEKRH